MGTAMVLDSESWHGWWLAAPLWILLWVVIVSALFRGRWAWRRCDRRPTAQDVLAGRFARGEIDADEYRSRRATLDE
jgi:putative membrane protein